VIGVLAVKTLKKCGPFGGTFKSSFRLGFVLCNPDHQDEKIVILIHTLSPFESHFVNSDLEIVLIPLIQEEDLC